MNSNSSLEPATLAAFDKMRADNAHIMAKAIAAEKLATFDLLTEVRSADGQQWQAIDSETLQARDIDHALSLIGGPEGLEPGTAWRVSVQRVDDGIVTETRTVEGTAPAALTRGAAELLACFSADGTLTYGGGVGSPHAQTLIDAGLIEQTGAHPVVYRRKG